MTKRQAAILSVVVVAGLLLAAAVSWWLESPSSRLSDKDSAKQADAELSSELTEFLNQSTSWERAPRPRGFWSQQPNSLRHQLAKEELVRIDTFEAQTKLDPKERRLLLIRRLGICLQAGDSTCSSRKIDDWLTEIHKQSATQSDCADMTAELAYFFRYFMAGRTTEQAERCKAILRAFKEYERLGQLISMCLNNQSEAAAYAGNCAQAVRGIGDIPSDAQLYHFESCRLLASMEIDLLCDYASGESMIAALKEQAQALPDGAGTSLLHKGIDHTLAHYETIIGGNNKGCAQRITKCPEVVDYLIEQKDAIVTQKLVNEGVGTPPDL